MTSLDLDPQFVQALRLLHSTNRDSIEQLQNLLDEAIRQKYGASKMLSNTLHKKYAMEETVLSDQSSTSSKKSKSSSSSKHSKHSSKNSSPVTVQRETTPDPLQTDDNLADILEDVACVICKGMDVGARNRLVECVKCGSLYHQECHTPHILDSQIDTNPVEWYCSNCTKTQPATKEKEKERTSPKVVETKSKESSSKKSSSSSSKHSDKYKSSSSSSQSQTSNGNSSSSKMVPNIHIVSADRRLKDMIKKAKQDKRSRSSNSGNSKHSSSSSSSKSSHDKSSAYKNKSD